MNTILRLLIFTAIASLPIAHAQEQKPSDAAKAAKDDAIDFNRARQLFERKRNGEKLSADEEAYLQRAMEARRRNQGAAGGADSRALLSREQTGLKPLCDMSAKDRYLDQDGGLYGHGENLPPEDHQKAAEQAHDDAAPPQPRPPSSTREGEFNQGDRVFCRQVSDRLYDLVALI